MTTPELFELENVRLVAQSDSGVIIEYRRDLHWVSREFIDSFSAAPGETRGSLIVTRWFAEKAGWVK